jgi:hypothetical protein
MIVSEVWAYLKMHNFYLCAFVVDNNDMHGYLVHL